MRAALVGIVCFVVAFIVGRMGPQQEIVNREIRIAELEQLLEQTEKDARSLARVTDFLQIDRADERPVEPASLPEPVEEVVVADTEPVAAEPAAASEQENPVRRSLEARIDSAAELWRSRSELARAAFLNNVDADDKTTLTFDVLMKAMNLRVEESIKSFAETIEARGSSSPEDGARLMHELTGAVVFTYDEMDRSLPKGWREKSGKDFELFNFIDPEVGRPLMKVEGLIENRKREPLF